MASPPARWHHAPVHGEPEPFFGKKNSHRTSRRRHELSPPPKQAGGEIPPDRIGRPLAPHHDVVGLDFPHAIFGLLGGARGVLHTRSASCCCCSSCVATRSKHTMQTPHVAPAHHDSDGGRLDEAIFLPEKASTPAASRPFHPPKPGSCAQPAATHFAAVSQASRRPSRTRLVPVRLAEGEIERGRCRLSSQRPASSSSSSSPLGPVPVLVFCGFPKSILAKGYRPRPKVVVALLPPSRAVQKRAKAKHAHAIPRRRPSWVLSVSPSLLVPILPF